MRIARRIQISAAACCAAFLFGGAAPALAAPGLVSGTVTGPDGAPLAGICVQVHDPADDDVFNDVGFALTGAEGIIYAVSGILAGDYKIEFSGCNQRNVVAEFYDDQPDFESSDLVTVADDADTANIDAQLAAGGAISGTVTGPDGAPLSAVCITAFFAFDSGLWPDGFAATRADGSYTMIGLRAGGQLLQFQDCAARDLVGEWFDDEPLPGSADPVAVTVGEMAPGIDAQLAQGGAISGTVTDPTARR